MVNRLIIDVVIQLVIDVVVRLVIDVAYQLVIDFEVTFRYPSYASSQTSLSCGR